MSPEGRSDTGGDSGVGAPLPACRRPSLRCCALAVLVGAALAAAVFFAAVWIGADAEVRTMRGAPGTAWLYASAQVCATVANRGPAVKTLNLSASAAAQPPVQPAVMHCGACGACSTRRDIELYNATRSTLTRSATRCATRWFLGGRGSVDACFRDLGFSPACRTCWVDNVACDMRHCVFTCLRHIIQGSGNNAPPPRAAGNVSGPDGALALQGPGLGRPALNPCLECDEKMCGPAFTVCAGANRRRAGILTDIARDERFELCNLTSPPHLWWTRTSRELGGRTGGGRAAEA